MKKLISSAALALSFLFGNPAKAGDIPGICYEEPEYPSHINCENPTIDERAAVMGANVALGSLLGCIGAEFSDGKCLEGLAIGASGGLLTYLGMELGSYNREIPFSGAAGRLVNDLGASMIANAMFSRGAFQRYETTIGPIILSFDKNEGASFALMPASLAGVAYFIASGHKLDPIASIEDMTLYFYGENKIIIPYSTLDYTGFTWVNIPAYTNFSRGSRSHEILHTYQFSRLRWLDEAVPNWLDGLNVPRTEGLRYGAEMMDVTLISYPSFFPGNNDYYYQPLELEAYALERN